MKYSVKYRERGQRAPTVEVHPSLEVAERRAAELLVDHGSVVVAPANEPLSAARAKRAVGRRPVSTIMRGAPIPEGERDDRFTCHQCGVVKPLTEVGRRCGGQHATLECRACVATAQRQLADPKRPARKRAQHRASAAKYRSGFVPPWAKS